jgi:serine/threonine protein kinase
MLSNSLKITDKKNIIYECIKKIGEGAFGNVFEARKDNDIKKYAIKQMVVPDMESKVYQYL